MSRYAWFVAAGVLVVLVVGCGGGGSGPTTGVVPPGGGGGSDLIEVGPLLVRPAKTANFTVEALPVPTTGACAFVALYGAKIEYLASQALLDRVVFASARDGDWEIYSCNLDGSNVTQLTDNTAADYAPVWSPDGSQIAFSSDRDGDYEIYVMNADGSGVTQLTSNSLTDRHPSWSSDGRRLVFHSNRDGNYEIHAMYADGTHQTNLTNDGSQDWYPAWSPDGRYIAWSTIRDGGYEIYKMGADGSSPTRLTDDSYTDHYPCWDPTGGSIAYASYRYGNWEVVTMSAGGYNQLNFSNDSADDNEPAYSSDGNLIAFRNNWEGGYEIWLQETSDLHRAWRVTDSTGTNGAPDLGNPVMQAERVLIGPAGSDRGYDPIYSYAYVVIAAFDEDGYRNLVRVGVRTADVGTVSIQTLEGTGADLAAVEVSAAQIVNLYEDVDLGVSPKYWDLDALNVGMTLLYFDNDTGKLVSVVAVQDTTLPSAQGTAGPYQVSTEGSQTVLSGHFAAIYDEQGHNLAPNGAGQVRLDSATGQVIAVD